MHRPRLLFVVNVFSFFLSHRLPVALAAQEAGYEVHVAGAGGGDVARIEAYGLTAHVLPLTRSSVVPATELKSIMAIYRLYRRLRPDIVHHITAKPILYGTLSAQWANVPSVINAVPGLGFVAAAGGMRAAVRRHGIWQAYRACLRHPNMWALFQNTSDRDQFISRKIVSKGQCYVIRGSGVDLSAFVPSPESEGTPTVVLPARLVYFKGVGEFAEAAEVLRNDGVEARFVVVGECDAGNPANVGEAVIKRWTDDGVLESWGYRRDMEVVLRQAHIVCLPSHGGEGLPKALAEAAAAGRAIVTTDVPGCRDVVEDGSTGLLVPARDATALAAALRRLIDSPELRRRMGAQGRAKAEREFGIAGVVAEHMRIYDQARASWR